MTDIKVEDSLYLLIVAIIIVVIALAFFAFIPPGGIGIISEVENFTLGEVGFTGENMETVTYGNFNVGDVNREVLKRIPQVQVSSSYFGGSSEKMQINILSAYVPLAREAIISFTVHDSTPAYGNLIVKWNGLQLYKDGASRGPYNLHIERQYVREMNSLEISCDGPGAYFWASTAYVLRDFTVSLDYGNMKLLPFVLGSAEIETFKNGALEFSNPSGGSRRLVMKVNGAEVFSAVPRASESIKFDMFNSPVTPGNNMIALSAPDSTFSLQNVVLKIFLSTDNIIKERTFSLPKEKHDLFIQGYRGKIELDLKRTIKPGSISIQLNGEELNVPALQKGVNTLLFTENQAVEGDNILKFSGTGGWEFGQVRIVMER